MSQVPNKERSHHEHGMSVLNYIAACSGFKGRDGENEAARDGTRLHGVMEKVIAAYLSHKKLFHVDQSPVTKPYTLLDALRGVIETETVTEEEEVYLEFCCREVARWLDKAKGEVRVERRVYIHNPDGTELNFGHYDLLIFLSDEVAIMFDYKFGWIPVPAAASNWQGKGYACGTFQELPRLKTVGVIFIQPKLHRTTRTTYTREKLYEMYAEVRDVIRRAQATDKILSPGPYCDYCALAATCTALLNEASRAVALYEGLPVPQGFAGLQISTPEDAARAMFVLDRLQVLIDNAADLKDRAKQFARNNGNMIAAPLPDGRLITVELKNKNAKRSANNPGLIAEVLKDWLSPEQVLGACDPKITALEEIFANAFVERQRAEASVILQNAQAAAERLKDSGDHSGAAQILEKAKADAKAIRVTKKHAAEILNATLQAEGLLSRPDARVEYLKVRVEKPLKQIT